MIIDFEHQAKSVALASKLTLILLRTIPCQRAFERHRNVRRQRTEQFDIFGEKFLPLQSFVTARSPYRFWEVDTGNT